MRELSGRFAQTCPRRERKGRRCFHSLGREKAVTDWQHPPDVRNTQKQTILTGNKMEAVRDFFCKPLWYNSYVKRLVLPLRSKKSNYNLVKKQKKKTL
jgi:hypothetical protein